MSDDRAPILLLHGGWGGAWCWSAVAPVLVSAGHPVLAPDLPGGGLNAREPRSFPVNDLQALATERSALADLSFEQYAAPAVALVQAAHRSYGPVVVAAHSINGMLLHYLGERVPEQIRRLVYVAAVAPRPGRTVAMDTIEPAWSTSLFSSLLVADPETVGALRINPAATNTEYRDAMRRCWFADVPAGKTAAAMRLLTCDNPGVLLVEASELTAERWGSIPRTWIRTSDDASIPAAGQDTNIAQLDAAFTDRNFDVVSVASGHMPFLSVPGELAGIMLDAARLPDDRNAT